MNKKFISITLALIFIFTALSSCEGVPTETTLSAPETTEEIPEEPVLYSFYAFEAGYSSEYVRFIPEKGSEEAENWTWIYAVGMLNGEVKLSPLSTRENMLKSHIRARSKRCPILNTDS